MRFHRFGSVLFFSVLASCASNQPPEGLLGAYQLEDGRTVSIRRSVDSTLRYRIFENGDTGRLYADSDRVFVSGAGFSEREPVELTVEFVIDESGITRELRWSDAGMPVQAGKRIGTERNVRIDSTGASLHARLHLPDTEPPFPAVVLVHGSGDAAGTEWFYNGDFFVANGFAVLAYDKRGSGRSTGTFTFDFQQLADDVVAAVGFLVSQPEIDPGRIGLSGYSQGAWVAPLAASRSDNIRFVVVNYGMVESPAEEARLEMRRLLVDAGVTDSDLDDADALIRAAVGVVASGLNGNWAEFEALKHEYRDADWLQHLDGTPVGRLVSYPRWFSKLVGKRLLPRDLPWHYDSREVLESSGVPMAWLLAEDDRSAPNEGSIAILENLIERGKPYSLTVFPGADHGMLTYTRDGEEVSYTGYVPGYFRQEVEALKRLSAEPPGG